MTKYKQHILHRVNLEINTDNEQKAFAIKADIDGFLMKKLFPYIENMFDESVSPEEIKRYDSIDLELNMNSLDNFEVINDQLISQLRERIENSDYESFEQTRQVNLSSNKSFASERQSKGFIDKSTNTPNFSEKKTSSADKLSNMINTFLFFLETGQLPWYATPPLLSEFIHSSGFSSSIQDKLFLHKLKLLFSTDQNALDRFIQQFEDELAEEFIYALSNDLNIDKRKLHSKISDQNQAIKDLLYKLIINSLNTQDFKISIGEYHQLRDEILIQTQSKTSVKKISNQIQKILNQMCLNIPSDSSLENLCLAKIQLLFREEAIKANNNSFSESHIENPEKITSRSIKETTHKEHVLDTQADLCEDAKLSDKKSNTAISFADSEMTAIRPIKEIKSEQVADKRNDLSGNQDIKTEPVDIKPENHSKIDLKAIYIQNAGLILAHPFFGDLFARTKCTDEKSKLLPEKKSQAIHLLHYLATQQEMEMEYNLTFEKFLCGVPLDSTINRKIVLSEHEKNECNDLLLSIISYWPALKNTSPDGLRQMFIQRDGKLDLHKTPYKLIIERKAQDVLLNKLQWNISIVKLPWLTDLLFVEW